MIPAGPSEAQEAGSSGIVNEKAKQDHNQKGW